MKSRSALRQLNAGYLLGGLVPGIVTVLLFGARELVRGYTTVLSTVVLGLIFAETGLFIAMFWALFSMEWSTVLGVPGIPLQSPQSLVLVVTADLSILGACTAAMTIRTQMGSMNTRMPLITALVLPAVAFSWILIMEYRALSIYANDGALGSGLLLITGLHFSHVCFGILFMAYRGAVGTAMLRTKGNPAKQTSNAILRLEHTNIGPIIYMHFVEIVWIGIHVGAYV